MSDGQDPDEVVPPAMLDAWAEATGDYSPQTRAAWVAIAEDLGRVAAEEAEAMAAEASRADAAAALEIEYPELDEPEAEL